MGLGGVAIAVLPSVAYPQTVVLGQAGGAPSANQHTSKPVYSPFATIKSVFIEES